MNQKDKDILSHILSGDYLDGTSPLPAGLHEVIDEKIVMHPTLGEIVDGEPVIVADSLAVEAVVPIRPAKRYCDSCAHVDSHAPGCPEARRKELELEEARALYEDELEDAKENTTIRQHIRRFGALLFRKIADKLESDL